METETAIGSLREHPFVDGFRPEHVAKLESLAIEARFEMDQLIFREGDESSLFYLLLSGKVALETHAHGKIFRIQTIGAGAELGWSSVLSPVRKQFQARSLDPVHTFAFDGARLLQACEADQEFGYAIMRQVLRIVAERLQATRMQLMDVYKPVGAKIGAKL